MRFYHPWLAAPTARQFIDVRRQIKAPSRCLTSDNTKAEDKAFNVKPNHCHVTVAVQTLILAQYNAITHTR